MRLPLQLFQAELLFLIILLQLKEFDLRKNGWNNAKGREIAKQVEARGGSEDDLKHEVAKAISNNDLVLTPFDPRRTFDEHGDFERAVKESEQQMVVSWNRDLAEIGSDEKMSAADKQEARRKLDERYQEYERQFNQIVERERGKRAE